MAELDSAARTDWERRVHQRTTTSADVARGRPLPEVTDLSVSGGAGHVLLRWDPVPGATGYAIDRRTGAAPEPRRLRYADADVSAVVGPVFADTDVLAGQTYHYRVRALAAVDGVDGLGEAWVAGSCHPQPPTPPVVEVRVDASRVTGPLDRVWHMIGSERLSQVFAGQDSAGNAIGGEFTEALRLARRELGVTTVRAHALLHDDLQVATRDADGGLRFDFTGVDRVYDRVLSTGLRPIVELSFMPRALASEAKATVFDYRGIISPPADWAEWESLVVALVSHLVDRYGLAEVARWAFEVWNEPNLAVFWTADRAAYFHLYEVSARAVKSVHADLRVGGPATAAGDWLEAFVDYVQEHDLPLDFLSTHSYGSLPIDPGPLLARCGRASTEIWWTEWGVSPTHFGPMHDGAFGVPFILSGLKSAQGRLQALAYWVVSDHFEELGRPPRLFHNGFGLLTVGNLRKPRFWALRLAEEMGDRILASQVSGDGAQGLVESWASLHDDGTIDVLIWNGTRNGEHHAGAPALDRVINLSIGGLSPTSYRVEISRVDASHSNIAQAPDAAAVWPDAAGWQRLRELDRLFTEPGPDVRGDQDPLPIALPLPMPGAVRVRLTPDSRRR